LRLNAKKYRDSEDALNAYKIAAVFSEFAPMWHKQISTHSWSQLMNRFKRGGLDCELLEKAMTERQATGSSFRFVAAYGAESDASLWEDADEAMNAQQQVAIRNREEAQFIECKVTIEREQAKFKRHKLDLEKWECATESSRIAYKIEEKNRNDNLLSKHLEKVYPVRDFDNPSALLPFVKGCINEWLETTDVDPSTTMNVFLCNLLTPGNKYLKSANIAIQKIADSIAASPERTCAIILAPNQGGHGDTYGEDAVSSGMKELEGLLGDDGLRIKWRKLTFTFSEDSLATQSLRAGWHPGVMVISDQHQKGEPDKLVSRFWSHSD